MSVERPPARPRLVLASGSPRRRRLLERLGVRLEVRPVDVDETPAAGEDPERYVSRLAAAKARAAGPRDGEVVLAADTIVVAGVSPPGGPPSGGPPPGGRLLGKPKDPADAERMLSALSGKEHEVLTGVAVAAGDRAMRRGVERTAVRFAELSREEIAWYVASGEPMDKAGAYAVQGLGALFVEAVTGNYSNVVGLPLPLTYRLLREAGFSLLSRRT